MQGYKVLYWDISRIYFNNKFNVTLSDEAITKIETYKQLESLIDDTNLKNSVFITDITYRGKVLKLFRLLSKKKCFMVYFSKSPVILSNAINQSREIKRLRHKTLLIKLFSFKELIRFLSDILSIYFKRFGLVKPYNTVFTIGSQGIKTIGKGWFIDFKKSKLIPINSPDYDTYLKTSSELVNFKKYCVFLDQYYPFHPDFKVTGQKSINVDNYYNSLNMLFVDLKNKFDVDVLIAAHPKAEKYKTINFFDENKIHFNKTVELVKNSQFVIAHNSTSISYAVLYNKPLIFITSDDMRNVMPGSYSSIITFSKVLDSTLINIDTYDIDDVILKVNYESYVKYKYKYLTSPLSENKMSKEIIDLVFSQM